MSIKTWLTPMVTSRMFSQATLDKRRAKAERARKIAKRPHTVEYFHQTSDPYSALLAQKLLELQANYDIELICHLVPPPDQSAAPEPDKLRDHSLADARLLRDAHRVMEGAFQTLPSDESLLLAELALCHALVSDHFSHDAGDICKALWQADDAPTALTSFARSDEPTLGLILKAGKARREELGHYLGGMLWYEGEWYWGPDRLHYLETRLQSLGVKRMASTEFDGSDNEDAQSPNLEANATATADEKSGEFIYPPLKDGPLPLATHALPTQLGTQSSQDAAKATASATPSTDGPVIEFFFSIRSPYSAIVAPRIIRLANEMGASIQYNFVLPMVMRGLPVPKAKREYIVQDTVREARLHGVPFGKMNDPVGKPTERVLSIMPLAIRQGKAEQWLTTAMQGIWSEGVDAGSDSGLKRLVQKAGLNWAEAKAALQDTSWRTQAEQNREYLFSLGQWGVPCFKVGDQIFWGQDRLWAVRQALQTKQSQPIRKTA